jgi:hypothetical protein
MPRLKNRKYKQETREQVYSNLDSIANINFGKSYTFRLKKLIRKFRLQHSL